MCEEEEELGLGGDEWGGVEEEGGGGWTGSPQKRLAPKYSERNMLRWEEPC